MNYLGHALLSFNDPGVLTGNLIGDFVKGKSTLELYPSAVRKGLILHRHIDSFTDQHPDILKAKVIFRNPYGLYSGAIVDTITDHFIANDPSFFSTTDQLASFAEEVYRQLSDHRHIFPEPYVPFYHSMVKHNWLLNYRFESGLKQSLNGLMRRSGRIAEMESAFLLLQENRHFLEDCYHCFIPDIIRYVKVELGLDGTVA